MGSGHRRSKESTGARAGWSGFREEGAGHCALVGIRQWMKKTQARCPGSEEGRGVRGLSSLRQEAPQGSVGEELEERRGQGPGPRVRWSPCPGPRTLPWPQTEGLAMGGESQHCAVWPGQGTTVLTGTSRGQHHTLQAGFSSRSQGLSGDKISVSGAGSPHAAVYHEREAPGWEGWAPGDPGLPSPPPPTHRPSGPSPSPPIARPPGLPAPPWTSAVVGG